MAKTYPNQNLIIIKKTPCKTNFLQISNEEIAVAAKLCGKSFNAFKLYLYLAGNEIGFNKALSYEDFSRKWDVKSSSYYENFDKLIELGFIVPIGGHKYEFYTTPQQNSIPLEFDAQKQNSALVENSIQMENSILPENGAIEQNSTVVENSTLAENDNLGDFLKMF